MSNLRFVNEVTLSVAANTVDLPNLFTGDFETYLVVGENFSSSATGSDYVDARLLDASGSAITTSNYRYGVHYIPSSTGVSAEGGNPGSIIGGIGFQNAPLAEGVSFEMYVYSPYDASVYTQGQWVGSNYKSTGTPQAYCWQGFFKYTVNERITGLQLKSRNGANNMDSGTIRCYGVAD